MLLKGFVAMAKVNLEKGLKWLEVTMDSSLCQDP